MEWRLFPEGSSPVFTMSQFFASHPWVDPVAQRGHAARTDMVADLVAEVVRDRGVRSITDLGCGDGSLLQKIRCRTPVPAWGYDVGRPSLHVAVTLRMVDARVGNILTDELDYGELLVATEVVEHLVDPRAFIRALPGRLLILSSPWDEDDQNHYAHHAWAWDEEGYRQMVTDTGWAVEEQRRCSEGFQAVLATR